MAESHYLDQLKKAKITVKEIHDWIIKNPVPKSWRGGMYSYAYEEMPNPRTILGKVLYKISMR